MNPILQFDIWFTSLIYHLPHTFFTDAFFSFISAIGSYGFLWIIIIIYIIVVEERRDHRQFTIPFLITIIVSILLSIYLKNVFMRSRPLENLGLIIQNSKFLNYPSDFSFPSLHAVVAFAAATFLSFFDKKRLIGFYLMAFLIAFSRVYLGFHYMGDVVFGAILGILIGFLSQKILNFDL